MTVPAPSLAHRPFADLLAAVADKTPAPGGGAVASATGALAAALAGMVVSYSVGKKNLAQHQPLLSDAQARLANARHLLLALADEDAAAYALLNQLQREPAGRPQRSAELAAAAAACVQIPLAALAASVDLLDLMVTLAHTTNPHLRSDLRIAAILAAAAAHASRENVEINLPALPDESASAAAHQQALLLAEKASSLAAIVRDYRPS